MQIDVTGSWSPAHTNTHKHAHSRIYMHGGSQQVTMLHMSQKKSQIELCIFPLNLFQLVPAYAIIPPALSRERIGTYRGPCYYLNSRRKGKITLTWCVRHTWVHMNNSQMISCWWWMIWRIFSGQNGCNWRWSDGADSGRWHRSMITNEWMNSRWLPQSFRGMRGKVHDQTRNGNWEWQVLFL